MAVVGEGVCVCGGGMGGHEGRRGDGRGREGRE